MSKKKIQYTDSRVCRIFNYSNILRQVWEKNGALSDKTAAINRAMETIAMFYSGNKSSAITRIEREHLDRYKDAIGKKETNKYYLINYGSVDKSEVSRVIDRLTIKPYSQGAIT